MPTRMALAGLAFLVLTPGAQAQRESQPSGTPSLYADLPVALVDTPLRITVPA